MFFAIKKQANELILASFLFFVGAKADPFDDHLDQVQLKDKELSLVSKFPGIKDAAGFRDSAQELFSQYKRRLLNQEKNMDPQSCKESLNAQIGFDFATNSEFKKFLSNMVNVEGLRCLDNPKSKSIAEVVQILINDKFQMQAFDSLTSSQTTADGLRTCQQTSVLLIGKSNYCYNTLVEQDDHSALILSVVDQSSPKASAPIYLRWAAILIQKMNDGRIKMYSLAYGRGPRIPLKFLAQKIMESKESNYTQALRRWMR
jgi:hypothetical protein